MCGYQLSSNYIYAASGSIGPNAAKPEPCPNDGQTLVPVTWEERCMEHSDRLTEEILLVNELRAQLVKARDAALAEAAKAIHDEWDNCREYYGQGCHVIDEEAIERLRKWKVGDNEKSTSSR